MSPFLDAIQRIDDIRISRKLKPVFIKMMNLFDDYFTKNDLMNVFDINLFFEKYLYQSTYPIETKLKMIITKNEEEFVNNVDLENAANLDGVYSSYFQEITIKSIDELSELDYLVFDNMEDKHLSTLTHEFIHFLTLGGEINYVSETGELVKPLNRFNHEIKSKHLISELNNPDFDNIKNDLYSYYYNKPELFEPLTELLAREIIKNSDSPSYQTLLQPLKLAHKVYDIEFPKSFLQRNMKNYSGSLTEIDMSNLMLNIKKIYKDSNNSILESVALRKSIHTTVADIVGSYGADVYNKAKDTTPLSFIEKHVDIAITTPYKNLLNLNDNLENISKLYIDEKLKANNISITENRVNELNNLVSNVVKIKSLLKSRQKKQYNSTVINTNTVNIAVVANNQDVYVIDLNLNEIFGIQLIKKYDTKSFNKLVEDTEYKYESLYLNDPSLASKSPKKPLVIKDSQNEISINLQKDSVEVTLNGKPHSTIDMNQFHDTNNINSNFEKDFNDKLQQYKLQDLEHNSSPDFTK